MVLYFYNYSIWWFVLGIYFEDLYVMLLECGKGYGKVFLVVLVKEVCVMGGVRFDWSVFKWNEFSIKFYESIGVKV